MALGRRNRLDCIGGFSLSLSSLFASEQNRPLASTYVCLPVYVCFIIADLRFGLQMGLDSDSNTEMSLYVQSAEDMIGTARVRVATVAHKQ